MSLRARKCRASVSMGLSCGAQQFMCQPDRVLGQPGAEGEVSAKFISGEHVGRLAMSEVGAGSDVVGGMRL